MSNADDRSLLLALFGLNRAGQILYTTLFVLAVPALVAWTVVLPRLRFSDEDERLFRAARHGNAAGVERSLAAGAHVNAASPIDGKTALFRAGVFGHADVVKLLLARDAVVHALMEAGLAPRLAELALVLAIEQKQTETARILVDAGVDVNCYPTANAPLTAGIETRNVALMTYLEEHGAREKP